MLRLVSWNVSSLRDDRAALVRVLRALEPDVVCVQEAPRFLLTRLSLRRVTAPAGLRRVCGGRPAHGPALLVRPGVEVRWAREHTLSRTRGLHTRGVAAAGLLVDGAEVTVASLHLGLREDERTRHAGEVLGLLSGVGRLVLAGDLNEGPEGPAWRAFGAAGLSDAYAAAPVGGESTFRSSGPDRRIDAVFVRGLDVVGCGVPPETGSGVHAGDYARATDHLPVLAQVRLA